MKNVLAVVTFALCGTCLLVAESNATRSTIDHLVRFAGSNAININRLNVPVGESTPEVNEWISQNRRSIDGTRGGPFPPTAQYVTTYAEHLIYVHILDWNGKNNISLPPVIDRVIGKAWLLNSGTRITVAQAPWGLSLVVPEEQRPNSIDTIVVLDVPGYPADLAPPRIINANPSQPILLQGTEAKLVGGLLYSPGPDWIENWKDLGDSVSWKVRVPAAGIYSLSMTYSCAPGCGGSQVEILAGKSRVAATLRETTGAFGGWMNFEKRDIDGTLRLQRGVNQITLRAASKSKTDEILRLYGLYLATPKEKVALAAAEQRARGERAPTGWLRSAKYGLMVHWIATTQPRSGPQKPFCEAVRDFDVQRFADMVKETGAEYLIFTLAHGVQKYPVPLKSVDAVLPGRTCTRDLPGEIADALTQRGMRLILYNHHGVGDPEWSKASGFLSEDKSTFFEHEAAILREVGLRYGSKLSGWWFDDRYPLQPFEQLYKATKAGNPDRIVAFNSWILPRSTEFQEYWAGEIAGALLRLPEKGYFDDDGPQRGLQPHALICLDDIWMHGSPDTEIHAPLFSSDDLATYIADCNKMGASVTMNIGVYEDGTASPATLEQLATIRRIIRGN